MSANGSAAGAARDRVLERALDVVERLGEHDRAAVHLGVEAGLGGELGQPVDRDVHLHRAAARLPALDRGRRSRRAARARSIWSRNVIFGCVAAITTSARSSSPTRAPRRGRGRCARRCGRPARRCGRRAERDRGAAQRLAHRAHAAVGEAPRAELAVADVADLVVRHHVGGAGRARPGPRADDAADRRARPASAATRTTRRAGRRCSIVKRRVTSATPRDAEPAQRPREPGLVDEIARVAASRACGGIVVEQRAEHVGEAAEPRVPALERVGVGAARTARSARAGARGRRRGAGASGRRGTGRSSRSAGRSCSRGARARARAGSSAA